MNNLITRKPLSDIPSITQVLSQLRQRLIKLEEQSSEYSEADEIILFENEIKTTKDLIWNIESNILGTSSDNDILVENLHANLELDYLKKSKIINSKMTNLQLLTVEDMLEYNEAVHQYNLLFNIIESLY